MNLARPTNSTSESLPRLQHTEEHDLHLLLPLPDPSSFPYIVHFIYFGDLGIITRALCREPPAIDDLLVAPTVVGNQLYDVAAEERALGDAIFVLGRAVARGRLNPAVFARTTRSLAREWYLKKALVRKIGRGMGLVG